MPTFRAQDGTMLAFRDDGQGLPLLALAGLTRDGRDFDYMARHLPQGLRLIRLDSRGWGDSAWAAPETYTVAQETQDAVALLDHLGLAQVAIVGSSRGGLIAMVMAATQRARVRGICLNDVGPVLEHAGLARIATYVGVTPTVPTLAEVADRMAAAMPGFARVPDARWQEETVRHYTQLQEGVGLTYDPALRAGLDAALAGPLPPAWPLFNACVGLPLALIRGANSDVPSAATATEMCRLRPDMLFCSVPDRGHIPFLDEPPALECLRAWLAQVAKAVASDQKNA